MLRRASGRPDALHRGDAVEHVELRHAGRVAVGQRFRHRNACPQRMDPKPITWGDDTEHVLKGQRHHRLPMGLALRQVDDGVDTESQPCDMGSGEAPRVLDRHRLIAVPGQKSEGGGQTLEGVRIAGRPERLVRSVREGVSGLVGYDDLAAGFVGDLCDGPDDRGVSTHGTVRTAR